MRIIDISTKTPKLKIGNTWRSGYQTNYNDPGFDIIQIGSVDEDNRPEYDVIFKLQLSSLSEELHQFKLNNVDNKIAELTQPIGGALQSTFKIKIRPDNYTHKIELVYGDSVIYKINIKGTSGINTRTEIKEKTSGDNDKYGFPDGYQISAYDTLIPEGSYVDGDRVLWLKDLDEGFCLRRVRIIESTEPLLHPQPVLASKAFLAIVRLALEQFEKYCRYKQVSTINQSNGSYTFHYNYPDYFLGADSNLELVPTTIANVGTIYHSFTSNYWSYHRPTFYMESGDVRVKSLCKWPVFISMGDDGGYREDSHIYGFTDREKDWFFDEFDLTMMKQIKSGSNIINLPFNVNFLQLDIDIQDLQARVEEHQATCSDFSWGWV